MAIHLPNVSVPIPAIGGNTRVAIKRPYKRTPDKTFLLANFLEWNDWVCRVEKFLNAHAAKGGFGCRVGIVQRLVQRTKACV